MHCEQISFAYLHLPLNLHPGAGFTGLGTSPSSLILVFSRAISTSGSGIGIADSSACVYHLPLNLHPGAGFTGLGTSPSSLILVFSRAISTSGSGIGIADSSACVYG